MIIESTKVDVNASQEEIFNFLTNSENIIELLPQDKISDWKATPTECSFKAQGGFVISLIQDGFEDKCKVLMKSGEKSPFPFKLTLFINQEIGTVLPAYTGGLFNVLRYKQFDLTFSIDFQSGGLFYSETRNFNTGSGLSQETVGLNDKGNDWRDYPGSYTTAGGNTGGGGIRIPGTFGNGALVGKENNRYLSARAYWYTARQRDASNVLLDASYIKLREVRFGYSIPQSVLTKLKVIKSANFGVMVQNAWLIWATSKQWGIDPSELENFYREGGQLSSTRQFGFNLRMTF